MGILPLSCDVEINIVAWAFPQIITVRKRSCGKVMFLDLSVSHSIHRGRISASVHARICPPGQTTLGQTRLLCRYPPGNQPSYADSPGYNPRPQADPLPPQTATAVDGTHPTGMLSCCNFRSYTIELSIIPCNVFAYLFSD